MLAAGTDALLGVGGAPGRVGALGLAEEDGHELVHAGVGEQQVRAVRQERGRRDDGVLLRLEEVEERLADLCAGHLNKVTGCKLKVERFGARTPQETFNLQPATCNGFPKTGWEISSTWQR